MLARRLSVLLVLALFRCEGPPPTRGGVASAEVLGTCPVEQPAPVPLPGISAEHRSLDYWLRVLASQTELDRPLLSRAAIVAHERALRTTPHRYDLAVPPSEAELLAKTNERLAHYAERLRSGALFVLDGSKEDALRRLAPVGSLLGVPETRVALGVVQVHCTPLPYVLTTESRDRRYDRNKCGSAVSQEPIQILGRFASDRLLVRTPYTFGFVAADAPLSAPIDAADLGRVLSAPRVRLDAPLRVGGATVPADSLLPLDSATGRALVWAPTRTSIPVPPGAVRNDELTRRAVLTEAFHHLGKPYGWGGDGGQRDCSELVRDVLAPFGVEMPRHSADQSETGTFHADVPTALGERERLALLDAANRRGIVLLHFPGHIMLYLGRSAEGTPMVLHAFAEYRERCARPEGDRTETLRRVAEVTVSDLSLGRDTSRRSFLERITRVTVIGGTPGPSLDAVARLRPAAPLEAGVRCEGRSAELFSSPRRPFTGEPLRFVMVFDEAVGPAAATLVGEGGRRITLPLERTDGPPYGYVARWATPEAGRWVVHLADGANVFACGDVTVATVRERALRDPNAPRNAWDRPYENLFSVFVETLFGAPLDDRTWPDLQSVLNDREHNLLYDHFGADEERRLRLSPDCADLPYLLRAYFAWKMGLPIGFRACSRGGAGRPPTCGELRSNVAAVPNADPVEAFQALARLLQSHAHSASARTTPRDESTDFHPVPLTRDAIRPGTVFADPYGHVMMVARWVPQPLDGHGVLVAADAQPDGTIGRPRFWRGTFLFTPETDAVGAGFKAFRPVVRQRDVLRPMRNHELGAQSTFPPFSLAQYEGTQDDFYDRVEALVNPRALDPERVLVALADALFDSAKRRVISVDNAEAWRREHPSVVIPMPRGAEIFLTSGPWEDFSTPSRDLRLLLAIDAVLGFPARVARRPAQYGVPEARAAEVEEALTRRLATELAERAFTYRGSDGTEQRLTVADVVDRARGLEVAYDPNDCPEIRWAAPEGSVERSRCRRRAPAEQQTRLERYRVWFRERRRPME